MPNLVDWVDNRLQELHHRWEQSHSAWDKHLRQLHHKYLRMIVATFASLALATVVAWLLGAGSLLAPPNIRSMRLAQLALAWPILCVVVVALIALIWCVSWRYDEVSKRPYRRLQPLVRGIRDGTGRDLPATILGGSRPTPLFDRPSSLGVWEATGLVGREAELAAMTNALRQARLDGNNGFVYAIYGQCGVGKTALVRAYLEKKQHLYAGGLYVVRAENVLHASSLVDRLWERITRGATPEVRTSWKDWKEQLFEVCNVLGQRPSRVLVVFDHVENALHDEQQESDDFHLVLEELRHHKIFVVYTAITEPQPKFASGKRKLHLLELARHDAISFCQDLLAPSLMGDNQLASLHSDESVGEFCDLLGCHPEALRLAIHYLNKEGISLKIYCQRLRDNQSGQHNDDGLMGLRSVFAVSYGWLAKDAQVLFAALGILKSRICGMHAVYSLGAALDFDQIATDACVYKLRRASLIEQKPGASGDRDMIAFNPIALEFAKELQTSWNADPGKSLLRQWNPTREANLRSALAKHYAAWVVTYTRDIASDEDFSKAHEAAQVIQGEAANVMECFQWALEYKSTALDEFAYLAFGMRWYWWVQNQIEEGMAWLQTAHNTLLAAHDDGWQGLRLDLQRLLGNITYALGIHARNSRGATAAKSYWDETIAICQSAGDSACLAAAHKAIGDIGQRLCDWDLALGSYAKSLQLRKEIGDIRGQATVHRVTGDAHRHTGDISAAEREYELAQKLLGAFDSRDRQSEGFVRKGLGDVDRMLGRLSSARELYQDSAAILQQVFDLRGQAVAMKALGYLELIEGKIDAAEDQIRHSLLLFEQRNAKRDIADAHRGLGECALDRARHAVDPSLHLEIAEREFLESKRQFESVEDQQGVAATTRGIADMGAIRANNHEHYQELCDTYRACEDRFRRAKAPQDEALTLYHRGRLAEKNGHLEKARTCYKNSLKIFERYKDRWIEAAVRESLGLTYEANGNLLDRYQHTRYLDEARSLRAQMGIEPLSS